MDAKLVRVTIRLRRETLDNIQIVADRELRSVTSQIVKALQDEYGIDRRQNGAGKDAKPSLDLDKLPVCPGCGIPILTADNGEKLCACDPREREAAIAAVRRLPKR